MRFFSLTKLFDLFCLLSIAGIWPRFIEPKCLITTKKKVPYLGKHVRIVALSDLHFTSYNSFWNKAAKKVHKLKPDILLLLGDYGNFGKIEKPNDLSKFLSSLPKTPLGSFAILGNHDYKPFVTVDAKGIYCLSPSVEPSSILKGLKRLFSPAYPKGLFAPDLSKVEVDKSLLELLEKQKITVLRNSSVKIDNQGVKLQLVGVEEYMCKKMDVEKASRDVDQDLFTILLMHNPDGIFHLQGVKPDIILSGHTHGAQINLPFLWKRFVLAEHPEYCRGQKQWGKSFFYIHRGLGSAFSFRLFSPPELLCLDLVPA